MANLRKSYELNSGMVNEGVWVELRDGIEVCVRSARSAAAKKARADAERKYDKRLRAQSWRYTPAQLEDINTEVLIACLLNWRGIEDDQGVAVPCTPEHKVAYLRDPTLEVFRDDVTAAVGSDDAFREEYVADIAGNSLPS